MVLIDGLSSELIQCAELAKNTFCQKQLLAAFIPFIQFEQYSSSCVNLERLLSSSAGKHNDAQFKMRTKEETVKFVLFCFYSIYSRQILLNKNLSRGYAIWCLLIPGNKHPKSNTVYVYVQ